jgi:threonine-phosphate decarboxylase
VSLKRAIQRRSRIAADRIVVGNGATELIDLIPRALSVRSALIVGPTYGEYACAVERAGGRVCTVMAKKADGFRPPLEEVVRRLVGQRSNRNGLDAVFLCQPNSPTGRACGGQALERLFQAADRTGAWVVVDESFIEYCRALSCVPRLSTYPRLIILRGFTKFYGLPGLRIGYSFSSPSVAAALRQLQPPWTVNAAAQRAAEAAMADACHAQRCLATVHTERAWMTARLSEIDVGVIPSAANFILLELPTAYRASSITAALRRRDLLVRDCSSIEGCTERMIRVAIRRRPDNRRLLAALTRLLAK